MPQARHRTRTPPKRQAASSKPPVKVEEALAISTECFTDPLKTYFGDAVPRSEDIEKKVRPQCLHAWLACGYIHALRQVSMHHDIHNAHAHEHWQAHAHEHGQRNMYNICLP